jgi:hypothetical protein
VSVVTNGRVWQGSLNPCTVQHRHNGNDGLGASLLLPEANPAIGRTLSEGKAGPMPLPSAIIPTIAKRPPASEGTGSRMGTEGCQRLSFPKGHGGHRRPAAVLSPPCQASGSFRPWPCALRSRGSPNFLQLGDSETRTYAGSMPMDTCIGQLFTSRPTRSPVERVQPKTR